MKRFLPSWFSAPSGWSLLVFLLAAGTGLYFQLDPFIHYVSPQARDRASVLVLSNLRKTVAASIERQHPGLSPSERKRLLKEQVDGLLREEGGKARVAIDNVAKDLDRRDPPARRYPYLLASDSYYYYSLTEGILQNGRLGEQIRGSKYYNALMLAPEGHWEPLNLHPCVGAVIHRVLTFFSPRLPLMFTVSFTPLVISVLSLIFFFIICSRLGCSRLSTLAGAVNLLLAHLFLKRNAFGWYDNDPYHVLFPLCLLAALFSGMQNAKDTGHSLKSGIALAVIISLYTLFWHGWGYLLVVFLLSGGIILALNLFLFNDRSSLNGLILLYACIPLGAVAGVGLFFGPREFFVLLEEGAKALGDFLNPHLSVWPDLYIGVGELRKSSPSFLIAGCGGIQVITIAIVGLLAPFFTMVAARKEKKPPDKFYMTMTLGVFAVVSLLLTLKAQRFALFFLVPLILLFSAGLNSAFDLVRTFTAKFLRAPWKNVVSFAVCLSLAGCLIAIPVISARKNLPGILNKIYDDTWNNALVELKERTPPETIVTTWWPPGHFIKATAQRRVTFDGATINKPQAYWVANILMSDNEAEALGLLRILNNTGNGACRHLENHGIPTSRAVEIIKRIAPLKRATAEIVLEKILPPEEVTKFLDMTHKSPGPATLMLYNEMIDNNIQFPFVADWDMKEVETINGSPELTQKVPAPSSKEYIPFLWSLAGGQPKYSGELAFMGASGGELIFEHNVRINPVGLQCRIDSPKFGQGIPQSIVSSKDGSVVESILPGANLPYSVLYVPHPEHPRCILLDRKLARSLLMRLYFFNDKEFQHFRLVIDESNLTGQTHILVYEIDWTGLD